MSTNGRRRVHVVPQTHYDAEVFLSREETFEMGFRNIELALLMLDRHPDYTFALDQVCYVRPYLERYPERREAFLRHVRGGRLTLEGGMHAMADLNIPCGESFIRQVLYGRRYFEGALGVDARCAWTLDSFGYHPQCPQLMAGCGFDWNIIQRGMPPGTPANFLWEGIDATRLQVHRMSLGYAVFWGAPTDIHQFRAFVDRRLAFLAEDCPEGPLLALTGADIAPPELHLPAMIEQYNRMQERWELVFSTPARYRAELLEGPKLPVVRGDFNGVFHGCYSARIRVKQRNRELETALLDWEKTEVLRELAGARPPARPPRAAQELADAWEPVLFNQFHDIICGSHVDVVYRAALQRFDGSGALAATATGRNLDAVVREIDTTGGGIPVVVLNTLAFPRSDAVEAAFSFAGGQAFEVEVRDAEDRPVPADLVSADRAPDGSLLRGQVVFVAHDVPSFGHEVYRIHPLPAGSPPAGAAVSDLRTSVPLGLRRDLDAGFIENSLVRVSFDLWKGVITSLVDRQQGWEAIAADRRYATTVAKEEDFGNFWQYNGPCKGDLFHPPMDGGTSRGRYPLPAGAAYAHHVDGDANIRGGCAFAECSIAHPWGTGHVATRVRLYAGLPRVEVTTTLVNEDERVRYRAVVPTSIASGIITHEIPFGAIERPEGEYPAQTWIDYTERDGERGIALLNRGLPGNNVVGGTMLLSLLKCTALKEGYAEGGGFRLGVATEQGYEKGVRHEFRYALVPHAGDWRRARIWEEGHGFNTPLAAIKTGCHPGSVPRRHGWLSVSPSHVVVSCVRQGERGIVVRVYEASGRAASAARIDLGFEAKEIRETDLVERNPRVIAGGAARGCSFDLPAFGIRTFEIVA